MLRKVTRGCFFVTSRNLLLPFTFNLLPVVMVRPARLERAAPRLGILCSILLSYGRMNLLTSFSNSSMADRDVGHYDQLMEFHPPSIFLPLSNKPEKSNALCSDVVVGRINLRP